MRTRIIAVLNQKGGVGKTTTCVSLGAALARRGFRVLLIDMDPQANLTVHLGADFREVRNSTYSLLLGEHALGPAVRTTRDPNLRYVPATLALANAEIQLASAVGRELLLREAVEAWLEDDSPAAAAEPRPRADFIFIDCPPSLGVLTMNALCAANEVLLPIQCEFFALQGVAGILESLKAVQRLNRGLRLSMVVPCMVDRRKTLAREVLDEVEKYFGKLVTRTRIRNNVKLAEAPSHGMTIFEYDAASNGARDYEALAREVLGEAPGGGGDDDGGGDTAPAPVASDPARAEPSLDDAAKDLGAATPDAVPREDLRDADSGEAPAVRDAAGTADEESSARDRARHPPDEVSYATPEPPPPPPVVAAPDPAACGIRVADAWIAEVTSRHTGAPSADGSPDADSGSADAPEIPVLQVAEDDAGPLDEEATDGGPAVQGVQGEEPSASGDRPRAESHRAPWHGVAAAPAHHD